MKVRRRSQALIRREEQIREERLAGLTYEAIAARHGISRQRVHEIAKTLGLPRESVRIANRMKAMRADYEAGMSQAEVAAKHGLSQSGVSGAFRRAGVRTRGRSEGLRLKLSRIPKDPVRTVVLNDYRNGMGPSEIAAKRCLSRQVVRRHIDSARRTFSRSRTDAQRLRRATFGCFKATPRRTEFTAADGPTDETGEKLEA